MSLENTIPVKFYKELGTDNQPVKDWLSTLSQQDRRTIGFDLRYVQVNWPVTIKLVKNLGSSLWELRSTLENRIARIIFTFHKSSLVLLHGFIKKTQEIPDKELKIAQQRLKNLNGD